MRTAPKEFNMKIEFRNFSTKRKFGVEMEISNTLDVAKLQEAVKASGTQKRIKGQFGWSSTNTGSDYWDVKTDSTCGPKGKTTDKSLYGFEVASYPAQGHAGLTDIGNVATCLSVRGAEVNKFCGMHVHADARDLKVEQVGAILANWLKIEPILFQAVPKSRRDNKYCKSLLLKKFKNRSLDEKYSAEQMWVILRPTSVHVHDNSEKKYALNSVGYRAAIEGHYADKHTLELRLPEGTLDKRDIKNWTRMFINFVSYSLNHVMPSNLRPTNVYQTLQILGLQGNDEVFYVLSEGLYETKIWFLSRLCQFSNKPRIVTEAKKILEHIHS